jgi:hypothetical protein
MTEQKPLDVPGTVRMAQIIVGGLAAGVAMFAAVAVLVGDGLQPLDTGLWLSLIMAALSITALPLRWFLPAAVTQNNIRKIAQGTWVPTSGAGNTGTETTDQEKLAIVFVQKTILGGAVLEGAAFANLVAFLLEGQIYSIALGVFLLVAILAGFPTRGGMEAWLERATRRVRESRDLAGLSR